MELATKMQVEALEKKVNELEAIIRAFGQKITPFGLVSVEIAQKMLECSRTTLHRKVKKGEIEVVKTGKKVRVSTESIKRCLIGAGIDPAIAEVKASAGLFL